VLAFRHDPSGALLDVPSPTELDVPAALLNFAGSFVLVSVLVVLLFRLVIRPRPMTEVTYVPGSVVAKGDLAAPDSEDDLPDDAERRDDETAYPTDD
jgi:hypothetical protein